jgi:hypothetical protein
MFTFASDKPGEILQYYLYMYFVNSKDYDLISFHFIASNLY